MQNFEFCNPTRLVFGKGQIARLATLIPTNAKVLVTFGGGSVKQNGVYDQVKEALRQHDHVEFWGIEPNPAIETLRKAIKLGIEENVTYLLAVGGGSVLDGTKLIASALTHPELDAWELVKKGYSKTYLPFASVMTLPATGSEMNSGAVISCKTLQEKFAFYSTYPQFSILDPEVTYTLPPHQVACSLADIFVHVMEQYMTTPGQSRVMDRWAEGVLQTVIEIAPLLKADPTNYDLRCDYVLSATLALNDMIRMGVTQDWATHMIGHELTALLGVTHGESLAMVHTALLTVLQEQKRTKLLQYAERVWHLTNGDEDQLISQAITLTKSFFQSLGLRTSLSEAGAGKEIIDTISQRFTERGAHFGELKNVDGEMARRILEKAL